MKLVRAGLGQHIDDAARKPSILCIVTVSLDPEFLNGVRVRRHVAGIAEIGHARAAVKVIIDRARAAVRAAIDQRPLLRKAKAQVTRSSRRGRDAGIV